MRLTRIAAGLSVACLALILWVAAAVALPGMAGADSGEAALDVSDELMPGYEGQGSSGAVSAPTAATAPTDSSTSAASTARISSGKLANAKETVDANGVVHGTMPDGTRYVLYGRGESGSVAGKVSFVAVGDVFATDMNLSILDSYAGDRGDGLYDFEPYYQGVRDEIASYDVRFVNQETPCAGDEDGYSYSGYPIFNTPDSSIHAIAAVGFNVANFNSNHSWDQGSFGIERTQRLFSEHPGIALIGSYASDEDRDVVRLVERNGATIAFLSYAYGENSYGSEPDAFPNQYYTCQFDEDRMREDVKRAQSIADAVVVYMHWGTEYSTQPNDQQLDYAQFLVDLDVDLVIGSHAHILQPVHMYTSPSGKQVPVVFGLSDFITGWTLTDTILSGAFSCDFVWNGERLVVENPSFAPAIEWSDGGDTYVRFLKDMSDDEIAANTRTEDVGDDVTYLHDFLDDLGMEVPVNW